MDIIIKSLLGAHVSSAMYSLSRCDLSDGTVSDVVYLPRSGPTEDLPPIPVVVRNTIKSTFMTELIKYSLSLYEEFQVFPVLLTFLVEGYSNEEIKSKFKTNQGVFLAEGYCKFWAKHCFVLSGESILGFVDDYPLNKLVALGWFIINTEKSLESQDPTIKLLSDIVNQ